MVMNWDLTQDRKLFINILTIHDFKLDYNKLAEMQGVEGLNAKAIVNRINRLKQAVKDNENGAGDKSPATPKIGKGKRKNADGEESAKGQKRKKADKPAGKKGVKASTDDEGDDDLKPVKTEQPLYDSESE